MPKKLTLRDVIGRIIDEKLISDEGKLTFLATLKTSAYEEGHVNWLKRNFEKWQKETEKISGLSFNYIQINKASKKGVEGSVAIGMNISGSFFSTPAGNFAFMGNVMSAIRKTLAEIVISCYAPKFDYKNPLFDALHVHTYVFTPACDISESCTERISRLTVNDVIFGGIVGRCGAILQGIQYDINKDQIFVSLRWKKHATEAERDVLEKVFQAYFSGMGIDCQKLKIQPQ